MSLAPIGRMLKGWDNKFQMDLYCKFCKKFLENKDINAEGAECYSKGICKKCGNKKISIKENPNKPQ